MTDNKEREAFHKWYVTPQAQKAGAHFGWRGIAWDAWQARASLAASQEKAEPVASIGAWSIKPIGCGDIAEILDSAGSRITTVYTGEAKKIVSAHNTSHVAAQASEPAAPQVFVYGKWWTMHPAPQPSAAVGDAALLEGIAERAGGKLTEQERGHIMDVARNIRALKSAPTQPAEQPSASPVYDKSVVKRLATQMGWTPPGASPAALTERDIETMQDVATELSAYLELYPTTHGLSALCLKFRDLIARAQGEQA